MTISDNARVALPTSAPVILGLQPAGPTGAPLADPELRARAAALLGPGPLGWATQVARVTCAMVVAESFDGPDAPVAEIGEAAESTLLMLLLRLTGHSVSTAAVTARQSEIVRYRISHAAPFHRVVASQRLIQHHWAELLLHEAARRDAGPNAMLTITATLGHYFDDGIDWHLRFYLAEQERFAHSEAQERARLIEALLAGRTVDPAAARRRLGVELAGEHVALVLADSTTDTAGVDPVPDTAAATVADVHGREADGEDRIARVLSAVSRLAERALIHRPAGGVAWLWLDGRATSRLSEVAALLDGTGLQAGLGGSHPGQYGFRRSHVEAVAALRFAGHRRTSLVRHRDVALAALLSADLERARWFVRAELGGLARADAKSAELRDTLSEYYLAGTRLSIAAAALHVHRNTLLYRLRHIAELLGRPVTDMTPETQCALLLAAEYGDSVLEAPGPGSASAAQFTRLTALHVG